MRLLRRRCAFLLDLLALTALFLLAVATVHLLLQDGASPPRGSEQASLLSVGSPAVVPPLEARQELGEAGWKLGRAAESGRTLAPAANCTMSRCFEEARCRDEFRVFVYPDSEGVKVSGLYRKFLRVVRNSVFYTSDPDKACLFIPSWDTLDRDRLSDDFVQSLPSLSSLPHWNGGRNHLLFNFYSGSWPTYSEALDFDPGHAMLAKASFNTASFRPGFDISLPLLHNSHPEKGVYPSVLTTRGNTLPIKRHYHLAFKGKRYLYGLGVEPRRSLYHIHNGRDVVMVTTCRHNQHWEKFKDSRCDMDNSQYNSYDYTALLTNSTFCLVPRGRRLGSFRFVESLQSSCIPVSLSNGYVLLFNEVIDWSQYSVEVDERHLLQVPHITRSFSMSQVLEMRARGSWVYETYLSSVEKVVMTTIEIIRNRLRPSSKFVWNRPPGGLNFVPSFSSSLSDYPFYHHGNTEHRGNYTIVLLCSKPAVRGTAPLIRLIKSLSSAPRLSKIVIMWSGNGSPRVSLPSLPVAVTTISRPSVRLNPLSRFHTVPGIETDAVLHLSEGAQLTVDEAEFGFDVWLAFPGQLVGFVGHTHIWEEAGLRWTYSSAHSNEYSVILSEAVFLHRYYSHALTHSVSRALVKMATTEPDCTNLILNFFISHITQRPPVKATHRLSLSGGDSRPPVALETTRFDQSQTQCLNMLVTVFGYMPLRHSAVRYDPVLFKDSVSMFRKEYRNLDIMDG